MSIAGINIERLVNEPGYWGKVAPEGSTHFFPGHAHCQQIWYMDENDQYYEYDDDGDWNPAHYMPKDTLIERSTDHGPAWVYRDGSAECPVADDDIVETVAISGSKMTTRAVARAWDHIYKYRNWSAFERYQEGSKPLPSGKTVLEHAQGQKLLGGGDKA